LNGSDAKDVVATSKKETTKQPIEDDEFDAASVTLTSTLSDLFYDAKDEASLTSSTSSKRSIKVKRISDQTQNNNTNKTTTAKSSKSVKRKEVTEVVQNTYQSFLGGVVVFQSRFRMIRARQAYLAQRAAAMRLQSAIRCILAARLLSKLKHAKKQLVSSILLQTQTRKFLAMTQLKSALKSALLIQVQYRRSKMMKWYAQQKASAVLIQAHFRRRLATMCYQSVKKAVIRVQSLWRRHLATKVASIERQRRNAAIAIQSSCRKILARKSFCELRRSTIVLQTFGRRYNAICHLNKARRSILLLQATLRGWPSKRTFLSFRRSVCVLQATYRARFVAEAYQHIVTRIVACQKFARRWLGKELALRRKRSILLIQTYERRRQAISVRKAIIEEEVRQISELLDIEASISNVTREEDRDTPLKLDEVGSVDESVKMHQHDSIDELLRSNSADSDSFDVSKQSNITKPIDAPEQLNITGSAEESLQLNPTVSIEESVNSIIECNEDESVKLNIGESVDKEPENHEDAGKHEDDAGAVQTPDVAKLVALLSMESNDAEDQGSSDKKDPYKISLMDSVETADSSTVFALLDDVEPQLSSAADKNETTSSERNLSWILDEYSVGSGKETPSTKSASCNPRDARASMSSSAKDILADLNNIAQQVAVVAKSTAEKVVQTAAQLGDDKKDSSSSQCVGPLSVSAETSKSLEDVKAYFSAAFSGEGPDSASCNPRPNIASCNPQTLDMRCISSRNLSAAFSSDKNRGEGSNTTTSIPSCNPQSLDFRCTSGQSASVASEEDPVNALLEQTLDFACVTHDTMKKFFVSPRKAPNCGAFRDFPVSSESEDEDGSVEDVQAVADTASDSSDCSSQICDAGPSMFQGGQSPFHSSRRRTRSPFGKRSKLRKEPTPITPCDDENEMIAPTSFLPEPASFPLAQEYSSLAEAECQDADSAEPHTQSTEIQAIQEVSSSPVGSIDRDQIQMIKLYANFVAEQLQCQHSDNDKIQVQLRYPMHTIVEATPTDERESNSQDYDDPPAADQSGNNSQDCNDSAALDERENNSLVCDDSPLTNRQESNDFDDTTTPTDPEEINSQDCNEITEITSTDQHETASGDDISMSIRDEKGMEEFPDAANP